VRESFAGAYRLVVLVSSVLVRVPSGDWVKIVSFDLTVPLLLVLVVLTRATSWAHPTSRNDDAKADIAKQVTIIRLFMEIGYGVGSMPALG
jgi:hypothetical protein